MMRGVLVLILAWPVMGATMASTAREGAPPTVLAPNVPLAYSLEAYQPVELIELSPWVWTFCPLDTLIAVGLGLLLGVNLAGLILARQARSTCTLRVPSASGLAALAPWLISLAYRVLSLGLWRLGVWYDRRVGAESGENR